MKEADTNFFNKHEDKLGKLRGFYTIHKKLYKEIKPETQSYSVSVLGAQNSTATVINQEVALGNNEHRRAVTASELITTLNNDMAYKMCSFWEFFIKDYNSYFSKNIAEHLNNPITEIILERNCLAHNDGIVDDKYCSAPMGLRVYEKDEKIYIRSSDVEDFFKYLDEGFKKLKDELTT